MMGAKLALRAFAGRLETVSKGDNSDLSHRSSDNRYTHFSRDRLGFMTTRNLYAARLLPERLQAPTSSVTI